MFELIVGFAMIGWIVKGIVRIITEADIRKQQFRFNSPPQTAVAPSSSEIQQLRAEIVQLRETTTQHAMSLQHAVERLDRRVEFLERKSIDGVDTRHQSTQQVVGR